MISVPAGKRIVYSTCSVHKEEDEEVVMNALGSSEARDYGWTLAPRAVVLPTWERRGLPEHMDQDQCKSSANECGLQAYAFLL